MSRERRAWSSSWSPAWSPAWSSTGPSTWSSTWSPTWSSTWSSAWSSRKMHTYFHSKSTKKSTVLAKTSSVSEGTLSTQFHKRNNYSAHIFQFEDLTNPFKGLYMPFSFILSQSHKVSRTVNFSKRLKELSDHRRFPIFTKKVLLAVCTYIESSIFI